ncbi:MULTISPECIES: BH0509 family protein [Bacillaceae]|uniref:BH0509 family protein n=2 Tax=Metabacillus TaxID=2675233 RepID=A0ABS5LBB6_9BACI|nr:MULTISPECIES: BH0509 family protein [Bacillaceae]KZZ83989.1 transporter [Bacillus sp. SJS]MBS2967759.1 BH0509 family protein [Metabacillus flavus]
MSRQERKNMVEYIAAMKEMDREMFMYMTDEEVEHIYSNVYSRNIEMGE